MKTYTIRMSDEIHLAIVIKATKGKRTMNDVIMDYLSAAIKKEDRKND